MYSVPWQNNHQKDIDLQASSHCFRVGDIGHPLGAASKDQRSVAKRKIVDELNV